MDKFGGIFATTTSKKNTVLSPPLSKGREEKNKRNYNLLLCSTNVNGGRLRIGCRGEYLDITKRKEK
jgi:hypothetical protein